MKRVLPILPLLAFLTTASLQSKAQVSVSVNIGAQPQWAPAGYASADYYYLPDIECYYYVPQRQFVYLNGPNWVFSYNLPARCRDYDLYSGYKVVCNGPRPYTHFYNDRVVYARYRGYYGHQPVIRDCGPRGGYYRESYYGGPRGHAYGHYEGRGYERHGYGGRGYEEHGRGHGNEHGHGRHGW
jgi:hypothetical protein